MSELSNGPIPYPRHLTPNKGLKSPPLKVQQTVWRLTKMLIEHVLGYIGWLWSDAMNNRTAFGKVPYERTQIEHNMCGRRAARSPLWWWPCLIFITTYTICGIWDSLGTLKVSPVHWNAISPPPKFGVVNNTLGASVESTGENNNAPTIMTKSHEWVHSEILILAAHKQYK